MSYCLRIVIILVIDCASINNYNLCVSKIRVYESVRERKEEKRRERMSMPMDALCSGLLRCHDKIYLVK
jgi:hypothetical protein